MANFSTYKPPQGQRTYPTLFNGAMDELDSRFNTAATFGGSVAVTGALTVGGNTALGNAVGDTVTCSGDVILAPTKRLYLDGGVDTYIHQSSGGIMSFICDASTELVVSSIAGDSRLPSGVRIGANSGNNLLDDTSTGAATATLYIGNSPIQMASDVRVKIKIIDTVRDTGAIIDYLRVVDHWWDDPSDTSPNNRNSRGAWMGLIAQEAVEHVPWLVNAPDPKCPMCLAGKKCEKHPSIWFMDLAYMAPLFVKEIQQLRARVRSLEAV